MIELLRSESCLKNNFFEQEEIVRVTTLKEKHSFKYILIQHNAIFLDF